MNWPVAVLFGLLVVGAAALALWGSRQWGKAPASGESSPPPQSAPASQEEAPEATTAPSAAPTPAPTPGPHAGAHPASHPRRRQRRLPVQGLYIWNNKAFELFYGSSDAAAHYAQAIASYQQRLPGITVYNMVVPNHSEFGLPERIRDDMGCTSPAGDPV